MFLGEYEHTMDDKGRVAVPARFRDELGNGVVITRGFDRCLMGFPRAAWEGLAQQVSSLSIGQGEARNLQRLLFSGAADIALDKQGRMLLPQNLREYAGLGETVILAGLNKHFEIWSVERWQEVLQTLDANVGSFADRLTNLGL